MRTPVRNSSKRNFTCAPGRGTCRRARGRGAHFHPVGHAVVHECSSPGRGCESLAAIRFPLVSVLTCLPLIQQCTRAAILIGIAERVTIVQNKFQRHERFTFFRLSLLPQFHLPVGAAKPLFNVGRRGTLASCTHGIARSLPRNTLVCRTARASSVRLPVVFAAGAQLHFHNGFRSAGHTHPLP
jgi:hypothetical protein